MKLWHIGYRLGAGIMTIIGVLFIAAFEYGIPVVLGMLAVLMLIV